MLETGLKVIVIVAVIIVVAATFLPLIPTNAWWVRALDIPRAQIAVLVVLVMMSALLLPDAIRTPALVALAIALVYQAWKIYPYTPISSKEVEMADTPDPTRDVSFLAANVLMENSDHARLRGLIEETSPDVLLLMETDQTWIDAMEPVLAGYSTVVRVPLDNHYGMLFATRLEAVKAKSVRLTPERTPTLFAELKDHDGGMFRFVGLHPRPPVPGQDTETRDAQILYAARFARKTDMPLVAMGDFNVAAWSQTAQLFKRAGGYLDPRIGRGLYSSFDATHPVLRCPIDQIHITADVALVDFHRGPNVGSDHFPMIARLRFDAELAARLNTAPEPLAASEMRRIETQVEEYRGTLDHGEDAI